jgi:hypothetical protein
METLGSSLRKEAELATLTLDVLKSSEIEGEVLNRNGCVPRLPAGWAWTLPEFSQQIEVEGMVEMMINWRRRGIPVIQAERRSSVSRPNSFRRATKVSDFRHNRNSRKHLSHCKM